MSITAVRKLPCRACGRVIEAVTIESANPTRHPHFQDQLLARTLLRMPCPHCRTEHLHYGRFVWTDLPGRLCVIVLHESERQAWAHLETSVRAVLSVPFLEEGPPVVRALGQETALRLAFGLEELREKVLCRVHDLDDRIIEAMKTELPYGVVLDAVLPAEALVFRDDRSVTVPWGIYEETAARRGDLAAELPGIFGPGATWVSAARSHRAPRVEPGTRRLGVDDRNEQDGGHAGPHPVRRLADTTPGMVSLRGFTRFARIADHSRYPTWLRLVRRVPPAFVLVLALVMATPGGGAGPASALASPQLSITASGATTVGFVIFANSNLTGGTSPGGTITFRLFAPSDTSCASPIFVSPVPVTGTSMNSAQFTTTQVGTYRWSSTYSGDSSNAAAGPTLCSSPIAGVVVDKARTHLSVTAPPPAAGTMHASAAVTGGYHPTGTIFFVLAPPGDTFCAATPVFTASVAVNGDGDYTSPDYSPMTAGTYKWRVTYGGDANSLAATMTSCLDPGAAVTVMAAVTPAALTSPLPGQANVEPAAAFTWSTVPGSQGYYLAIGTTYGGYDLVNSGILAAGQSSFRVTALPAGPLYATLCTEFNGAWLCRVNAFTAVAGEAALTHPTSGQADIDASTPFTWSTVAAAQGYYLVVGTTPGAYDVTNSGILPPGQSSYTVASLPSGQALYAVILTYVKGSWARFQCLRFTSR